MFSKMSMLSANVLYNEAIIKTESTSRMVALPYNNIFNIEQIIPKSKKKLYGEITYWVTIYFSCMLKYA
jgi:hypothetical protein